MVMSMGYGAMVLGHGWLSGAGASGGKSAVQLLQESKSRYVKSDRVLVSRQEPSRPDHLHISANPNIFLSAPSHTLHISRIPKEPNIQRATEGGTAKRDAIPPPVPPRSHTVAPLTAASLAQHLTAQGYGGLTVLPPPLPARFPRAVPKLRAKTQPVSDAWPRGGDLRRSLSHGPADRSNTDVQMKLRKLLNTDSKESLHKEQHQRVSQKNEGTFRAEVASVTIHKSLPELPFKGSPEFPNTLSYERRPSCPGFLAFVCHHPPVPPAPPPRPPRRNKDSLDSPKPPPRPPPPKIPPRVSKGDDSGVSLFSNVASSDDLLLSAEDSDPDQEDTHRRPILRSKSDVTHERNGVLGGGSIWGDDDESSNRSSYCSDEVELFFDSMGMDSTTLKTLDSPVDSFSNSPPTYFDDVASEESGGPGGGRKSSSDSDDIRPILNTSGLTTAGVTSGPRASMKKGIEPSIIEKNARVIKWLFNCQKARSVVMPRSLSSGS